MLHAVSLSRSIDDGWPVSACTSELAAEQDRLARNAAIFFVAGGSLWLAGTAFDFVQAGRAARRWNERHAITVAPTAHGIALAGRF